MLIPISAATLGKMPIITNSAIPSPNVPDANANRLFFIFLTQSYKCHKSKTKKSMLNVSCCKSGYFLTYVN